MNRHSYVPSCLFVLLVEVVHAQADPRLLTNSHMWRDLSGAPTYCANAADTLNEPPTETRPSERYQAAVNMRRCLQWKEAQDLSTAPTNPQIQRSFEWLRQDLDAQIGAFKAQKDFQGISFGVGVGVSFADDDVISEAEVGADNIVRATKDETTLPRVILESHYYGLCETDACNKGTFGIGPYFGIVAKSDELLSAFSAGVMFGWKDSRDTSKAGFSVGIGALLDSDVQSLADGFEEGQPLPEGEDGIRFKSESRWSAILFFTRTF